MAKVSKLIPCPTCGKTISENAVRCPHCGAKNKKKKKKLSPIFAIIVFCIGCTIIGIMGKNMDDGKEKSSEKGKHIEKGAPITEDVPVPVVFDVLQYLFSDSVSGAYLTSTEQEVISALGEPEDIDVWTHERSGLKYEIRSLSYDDGTYVYEFNNNYLMRIQIFDTFTFDDKDNILPMFGLKMFANSKKVDTGSAYRVYDCGIHDLWCTFGESEGSIDITYISYTDLFS